MPDAIFADPRLAPLYDAFDGPRDDLTAYVQLADELGAGDVLDVGCGTGSLAVLLAMRGCRVVAADPALASLEIARGKPGAETVHWICADTAALPAVTVDLAVMTGNVAQVFLTDTDWRQALTGIRHAIRADGHLVFEARRPADRAWERWAAAAPLVRTVPGVGRVAQRLEVVSVALPLVSIRHSYTFADGSVVTSASTLRFRERGEVEADLAACGFAVVEVRDAPDRPGREFVFLARRADDR